MRPASLRAWRDSIEESMLDGGETVPPPCPIEALSNEVRSLGSLGETEALALMDEIARLRKEIEDGDPASSAFSTRVKS